MADTPRDETQAPQERGAGDGPGDAADSARVERLLRTAIVVATVNPYAGLAVIAVAITLDFIERWNANNRIPQCQLFEGHPEVGGLAYTHRVVRESQKPYTFTYSDPTVTITAIACVPVSAEIESPEAEVTKGGINYNFVTICLTPVKRGRWACEITICGKPSTAKPSAAKPSAAKPSAAIQSTAKPAIEAPQQAIQKAVKQYDELSVKEHIQQTIKQAVQEAVQEVVKQTVEEAVQAVQQSVNQVIQEAVQQTAQQAVQESVQQPAQQVIQQADQQDTQQAVKQRRRRRRRRL